MQASSAGFAVETGWRSASPEHGSCHPQVSGMNCPLEVLPCSLEWEESLANLLLHISWNEFQPKWVGRITQESCGRVKNWAWVSHSSSFRSLFVATKIQSHESGRYWEYYGSARALEWVFLQVLSTEDPLSTHSLFYRPGCAAWLTD